MKSEQEQFQDFFRPLFHTDSQTSFFSTVSETFLKPMMRMIMFIGWKGFLGRHLPPDGADAGNILNPLRKYIVMVMVIVMDNVIVMFITIPLEVLRQAICTRSHCHGIMAIVICLKRLHCYFEFAAD